MQKYSIILPVRNGGDYAKECINSLLAQTYPDYNVIVLDNNSSDGTPEWIGSLNNDKIIIHSSGKDLSIEQNWSRIKDIPKNEFMTMIGHDDILHPGYLAEMDKLIQKHPGATLYQTHFEYVDENGEFIRDCLPMEEKQFSHEFLAKQMKRAIDSTGTGYLFRSKDFDQLGGMPAEYPNLIFSDYQLWLSLMEKGYFAVAPAKRFSYRLHQSLSVTTNGMAYQQAFFTYLDFLLSFGERNSSIKETLQQNGRSFLLYYCEALSHRLLKTPMEKRSIKVAGLIKKFEIYAKRMIPGQSFKPRSKFRTWIAMVLDKTSFSRNLFRKVKGR